MKRLLWLLLTVVCYAQVPITIKGTIVDSSNNVATSGYVQFSLSPLNQGLAYEVLPNTVIASVSKCMITSSGQLTNFTTQTGLCLVWPNDLILPSNTLYTITIAPNNKVTRVYNNVVLKSTINPQSLATLTFIQPQPVVGTIIGGSPLVTMSVIPDLDLVWTLGDPQHRYTHVYANVLDDSLTNLTVNQLHVTGFIDNPLGPLLLQDDVVVTGELYLDECLTFNTAGPFTDTLCPALAGSYSHQLPSTGGVLAPLNSPQMYGTPTAPTPPPGSNDSTVATTAFVKTFIAPSSPVTSVFGRIGAIASVIGDYNVGQVTGAAPINNPVFTGDPQAPTPPAGDNDTSIATTAFVNNAISPGASSLITNNGYAYIGPIVIQWALGAGVTNPGTQVVTLPIVFPHGILSAAVSCALSAGNDYSELCTWGVTSKTASTVTVYFSRNADHGSNTNKPIVWAIGF